MPAGRKHRVARHQGPIGARELRPPAEDVAARRVDAVENAMAAGQHAGQLEAEPPRQRAGERAAGLEHRARARRFEREQRPPCVVASCGGDVLLGDAEAREVRRGQIHATLLPIDGDVLPEVDELQSGADRVARAEVRRRLRAVEAQHQPADRVGGTTAVVEQVFERRVARRQDVLPERGQEVAEQREGQAVTCDRRRRARERAAPRTGCLPRSHRARVRSDRAPPGEPREKGHLRRQSRRRCAQTGRSRRQRVATPSARATRRQESFRNERRTREIWRIAPKALHFIGKVAAAAGRFPGVQTLNPL